MRLYLNLVKQSLIDSSILTVDESKQWIVGRIEYLLQVCADEWSSKRLQFDMLSERCLTMWNEARTVLIGSTAFIATVLSTFISVEADAHEKELLIQWLGIGIGIGIIAAFSLYIVRGLARSKLRNIQREFLFHEATMNYLKGLLARRTHEIDKVSIDNLNSIFFLTGAIYGNTTGMYGAYVDGLNSKLL